MLRFRLLRLRLLQHAGGDDDVGCYYGDDLCCGGDDGYDGCCYGHVCDDEGDDECSRYSEYSYDCGDQSDADNADQSDADDDIKYGDDRHRRRRRLSR